MSPALPRGRRFRSYNDVDLKPDELGGDFGDAFGASLRPAILDRNGATLDPAEFTQSPHKSGGPLTPGRSVVAPRNPMVGSFPGCWARAASGHAVAAPPSSVMNSRRLIIRSPRRRGRAASAEDRCARVRRRPPCRGPNNVSPVTIQIAISWWSVGGHASRSAIGWPVVLVCSEVNSVDFVSSGECPGVESGALQTSWIGRLVLPEPLVSRCSK